MLNVYSPISVLDSSGEKAISTRWLVLLRHHTLSWREIDLVKKGLLARISESKFIWARLSVG